MKNVIVTGGSGFVGYSIIIYILQQTNYNIICPLRGIVDDKHRLNDISNDRLILVSEYNNYKDVEYIFYCSGNSSAASCINNPLNAIESNICLLVDILEYSRNLLNLKRFIFISSVDVYGIRNGECFENDKCNSNNMYAATKLAGEHILQAYYYSYGTPFSIFRLNNTFGHKIQSERFPALVLKSIIKKIPLYLHINESGTCASRRWTPIEDVIEMIFFVLNTNQPSGEIYNATHSEYLSNEAFARLIEQSVSLPLEIIKVKNYDNIGRSWDQNAPPKKIYDLGWKPSKNIRDRIKDFTLKYINN